MRGSVRNLIVGFFALMALLVPSQLASAFASVRSDMAKRNIEAQTTPGTTSAIAVTPTMLRQQPCATCPVVAQIPAGTTITVQPNPTDVAWWVARYDGLQGFVQREHTILSADAPLANLHQPRAPVASTVVDRSNAVFIRHVVNAGKLNVRSGPGTDFPVLTQLSEGDEVRVMGEEFGWYRIMLNGGPVFVRSQYVTQQIAVRNNFVEPLPVTPGACQNSKAPNPAACLRP